MINVQRYSWVTITEGTTAKRLRPRTASSSLYSLTNEGTKLVKQSWLIFEWYAHLFHIIFSLISLLHKGKKNGSQDLVT